MASPFVLRHVGLILSLSKGEADVLRMRRLRVRPFRKPSC